MAESLPDILRRLRSNRGWSQHDLARESCVPQSTLAGLESGRRIYPRPVTLARLALALEVDVGELVTAATEGVR